MNSGIILVNKPVGMTSRDVVNSLCKHFNTKKIGHTGTLDPYASGLLVCCVNEGLKLINLMEDDDKQYLAEVTLGLSSETLDLDCPVIKKENVSLDDFEIVEIVNSFNDVKYLQQVPLYSAKKINGKKLYEYAREGIQVDIPSANVHIKHIEIIDSIIHQDGLIKFKINVLVSKGTYIRSLVRDIGSKLGVSSVVSSLKRIKVGDFDIDNSYDLNQILNGYYKFISVSDYLSNFNSITVSSDLEKKIRNGCKVNNLFNEKMCVIKNNAGNILAIYTNVDGICKAYKMFV